MLSIVLVFLFSLWFRYRRHLSWWRSVLYAVGWTIIVGLVGAIAFSSLGQR